MALHVSSYSRATYFIWRNRNIIFFLCMSFNQQFIFMPPYIARHTFTMCRPYIVPDMYKIEHSIHGEYVRVCTKSIFIRDS